MEMSSWLSHIKKNTPSSKSLTVRDNFGRTLSLEWLKTSILSPNLALFKKNVSELGSQVTARSETEFLKAYPEAAPEELFLKPCIPLLEKDLQSVDWSLIEKQIKSTIKQFYLIDLVSFGDAVIKPLLDDVYFLVHIKHKDKLLGFAMFAITPALAFGNVKVINVITEFEKEKSNLEQLLISSIFTILPDTKRIFVYVRPTNKQTLENYLKWGFSKDLSSIEDPNHKTNASYQTLLEYKSKNSQLLENLITQALLF